MTQEVSQTEQLKPILECLLFLSDKPIGITRLKEVLQEVPEALIKETLEEIRNEKASEQSGIELLEISNGYQLRTKPQHLAWIFRLNKARPVRLSRAALETLSIVGYRQPVTRPEVDEIESAFDRGLKEPAMAYLRYQG